MGNWNSTRWPVRSEEVGRELRTCGLALVGGRDSLQNSALSNSVLAHKRDNGELEFNPLASPPPESFYLYPFQSFRPSLATLPSALKQPYFFRDRHANASIAHR